jgi:hypothetical protein
VLLTGHETRQASYAVTVAPLASVPVAQLSSHLVGPRSSAATKAAQSYSSPIAEKTHTVSLFQIQRHGSLGIVAKGVRAVERRQCEQRLRCDSLDTVLRQPAPS